MYEAMYKNIYQRINDFLSGMRAGLVLLSGVWLMLAVQPLQAADDSPYLIAKKDFKKRVKFVSLSPLSAPELLQLNPATRAFIEAEVVSRLGKTKLEVLPIEPYRQLRTTLASQIGGLNDEQGVLDPRRKAVVWDHAKREMLHRHEVDAFAEISLQLRNAVFKDDRAEWDGIKQKVVSSGDGFALFGGKNYQGTIAAVSFQLAIFDRADELLFASRGGIEVLQEREGDKLILRDAGLFLKEEKKLKKAVQLAFKPL